jgi:cytosine/adenosine deaminase-related metal-dependent hydrolase
MIIRARVVVTMDGPPIANGAVAIRGNRIAEVGRWEDLRRGDAGEVVDVGECALLPGLINAHCHLDYTNLRGSIPRGKSFPDWIRAINERKASWGDTDYARSIDAGFAEAARFGTTTIVNLEAFPRVLAEIAPPPLRTWWFAEMIDVREPVSVPAVETELSAVFGKLNCPGGIGLAPHAPFTASPKLYAEAAAVARAHDLPLTTHLAESRDEMAMFREGRGALFDFLRSIGRAMEDCGDCTPLALLVKQPLLDERWIIAHLNELTPDDLQLLKSAPKFHIAHCPRSHAYFAHSPFALMELRELGFNICLGTDSLASNDDLSLFAEMRQLWKIQPSLRAEELVEMVTINPAAALRQSDALGRLRPSYFADMIAVPTTGEDEALWEEIVDLKGAVPWSMVNGQQLFRA